MPKYLTRQSPGIRIRPHDNEEYYHETNLKIGGDAFKLGVGGDCNTLLDLADELERATQGSADEVATVAAIRSLVDRVAQFEELEVEHE